MPWKMGKTTADRLRRHAVLRARREARLKLSVRLDANSIPFALLADERQDELVAVVQAQPKREERAFPIAQQALVMLRTISSNTLPEMCVWIGWSIQEDAAALLRLSDGLALLECDSGFFSPDGCWLTSPDGLTGVMFDFDEPPECCPGYLHLFGERWASGALKAAS